MNIWCLPLLKLLRDHSTNTYSRAIRDIIVWLDLVSLPAILRLSRVGKVWFSSSTGMEANK